MVTGYPTPRYVAYHTSCVVTHQKTASTLGRGTLTRSAWQQTTTQASERQQGGQHVSPAGYHQPRSSPPPLPPPAKCLPIPHIWFPKFHTNTLHIYLTYRPSLIPKNDTKTAKCPVEVCRMLPTCQLPTWPHAIAERNKKLREMPPPPPLPPPPFFLDRPWARYKPPSKFAPKNPGEVYCGTA